MNVKELIKNLQKFPQNAEVIMCDNVDCVDIGTPITVEFDNDKQCVSLINN